MAPRPVLLLAALLIATPAVAQPVALSLASNRVAVAEGEQAAVKVMDLDRPDVKWSQKLRLQTVHPKATPFEWVSSLAFSPDGKTLAVGGGTLYHGHVALLDAGTGKLLWVTRDVGPVHTVAVTFSPDGTTIGTAVGSGRVTLLDARTGEAKQTVEASGVTAVAFSPDGKTLATAGGDNAVSLWDLSTGRLKRALKGGPARLVRYSPEGKLLVTVEG
jgi:WD40 repeat protein